MEGSLFAEVPGYYFKEVRQVQELAENSVECIGEEVSRSLVKMLQCPVRDAVWVSCLVDLETSVGLLNFVMGV